ncbi:MAG: mechanosensitive ion channel domain-containing protein [Planctomycetota bacterium]
MTPHPPLEPAIDAALHREPLDLAQHLLHWLPLGVALGLTAATLWLAHLLLIARVKNAPERRLPGQITLLVLTLLGVIVVVMALPGGPDGPVSEDTRGNLLGLIGLAVTALITLSSTTLAANALAGLMLRATAPFKGGDWVRVGEHFGRVTHRALFHTEVQTEDKDVLSLPNLYLATNPVRIVLEEGTIVSAEVSLGYDTPHHLAEFLLIRAAERAELKKPFVWIIDLQDHAVVYRIAGLLEEVSSLISARSRLRACMLDTLHSGGVEIASPSLMVQRRATLQDTVIPKVDHRGTASQRPGGSVEAEVFDKAEQAARVGELEKERDALQHQLKKLKAEAKPDTPGFADIESEIVRLEYRLAEIGKQLEPPDAKAEG